MQTLIHTPTPNLKQSLDFYTKLNFRIVSESSPTLVSDGLFLLEINPDRYARAGVKLFQATWEDEVEKLKKLIPIAECEDGYLLDDPGGARIYLVNHTLDVSLPPKQPTVLGSFAGISLETIHLPSTAKIWNILGFEGNEISGDQRWMTLTNKDGLHISLMSPNTCPHLFFNPSLTYFNGKENMKIINQIRKLRIPITEEITCFNEEGIVDNIIIRDPGGYGFFIFND